MAHAARIGPQEVRRRLLAGDGLTLVCAYESDAKFERAHLEGALPHSSLAARLATLPRDTELVFYCG
jgi:hypothetical protein